jgi:hypothetical protein
MTENNYFFYLNKRIRPNNYFVHSKNNNYLEEKKKEIIIEGPTGPPGLHGDRFATKTINKILLEPKPNAVIFFDVEPDLAYIGGNSVIVAETADSINSTLNTFEATIQYYNKSSGQIVVRDIVNIHGTFGVKECYYFVNLDGVDGEQGATGEVGPTGEPGPTGPSNISEHLISIELLNDTIIVPEQNNSITYYSIHVKNGDEVKNIENHLKNNQTAILLFELENTEYNSHALIYNLEKNNIKTNFKENIILNADLPFVMMKIYNIQNYIFIESVSYYKNNYITV